MRDFSTTRKAKEYLISQIVGEAGSEGVELNEIERKMLYFSESGWTLPGILKVNEEFERDYDNDEYERKIAGLIRGVESRQDRAQDEIDAWDNAVLKLSDEDHYLTVLIDLASGMRMSTSGHWSCWVPRAYSPGLKRPQGDVTRLIVAATVLSAILMVLFTLLAIFSH
jgi:hypothetical protein